ncbi:putative quinol monooxygenase [Porphyrobacter sp. ULC335]|uniref:putative quinol monooxygenase n=1 Tax=Porphyrobacter sp. ULC335 TaxID=2854260 RepID=UPI0022208844|nr:putative quinol monooxygenase [Porphyrobacter sp. ULC335]UYV14347.1 antibiotic biosynthesis monooxygenase [Porphyrobacter sp. ULC335]
MLIVLAKAQVGESAMDAAKAAIADMVAASNAEEGCIAYAFTQDVLQPGTLHIVEKWQDEAALAAHFATPHMAAFGAAIAGLDFKVIEALKFHTDEGLPVM